MKKMKRCSVLILAAALVFSASAQAFAVTYRTETVDETLGEVIVYDNFDMWHYSGGYWKVGDEFNSWTWTDAEIGGAMNIGRQLAAKATAYFPFTYPEEWKSKIVEGVTDRVYISSAKGALNQWYNVSSFGFTSDENGFMSSFKPVFHVSSLRTFDDYVSGLRVSVPLIDVYYGNNLYSMFSSSRSLGKAVGRYWDSSPYGITRGFMHPAMIANSTGKLVSGYPIDTESGRFESDGIAVGTNTLINGGAVGLLFEFPLVYKIRLEGTRKVPVYTQQELAEQERQRQAEEAARRAAEEEARRRAEEEARRAEEERQRQQFIESLDGARIHRLN